MIYVGELKTWQTRNVALESSISSNTVAGDGDEQLLRGPVSVPLIKEADQATILPT